MNNTHSEEGGDMRYSLPYWKEQVSDDVQSFESRSDTDLDSGVKPINPKRSRGGRTIDSYRDEGGHGRD